MTIKQLATSVAILAAMLSVDRATARAETPTSQRPSTETVTDAVGAASRIAGVSAKTLVAQLAHESAFRRDARNRASSAAGPAQFLEATWLEMIRRYGAAAGLASEAAEIVTINGRPDIANPDLKAHVLALREDPQLAAVMAAHYLEIVATDLGKLLGRRVSELETRMAYVLGAGGAALLLKAARTSPREPAAALLPEAAKANPLLFHDEAGKPLGAAACLGALRQALHGEAAQAATLAPPRPTEHVGDLVAEPTPTS